MWAQLFIMLFLFGSAAVPPDSNTVEERFKQLTKSKLDSLYSDDNIRYKMVVKRLPKQLTAVETEDVKMVDFPGRGWPKGYATVDVHYNSKYGKRIAKAQVNITVWQYLPVLKNRLAPEEAFRENHFSYQWIDITRLAGTFVNEPNKAIGLVSARLLQPGEPVRTSDLKKQPIVDAGDKVSMIYRQNGLKVELPCVTRQSAAKGEEIRVFNNDTRKTYLVTVVDKNKVKWLRTL